MDKIRLNSHEAPLGSDLLDIDPPFKMTGAGQGGVGWKCAKPLIWSYVRP